MDYDESALPSNQWLAWLVVLGLIALALLATGLPFWWVLTSQH